MNLFSFTEVVLAEEKQMSIEADSIRKIYDFHNKVQADEWVSVNDNVMGGISKGEVLLGYDDKLIFSGSISLENNGGFASILNLSRDFDMSGYEGLRIRVKGDGRIYQFRLSTDNNKGVAFKNTFQTKTDSWIEIDFPFSSFQPSYRGRILDNVSPLDVSEIRKMGFLIADKMEGPFSLVVDEILAYR